MFEAGNSVTLKKADQYDRQTLITTEEVGEILHEAEPDGTGQRWVVAMQNMVDEEGVTPLLWLYPSQMNLHQI